MFMVSMRLVLISLLIGVGGDVAFGQERMTDTTSSVQDRVGQRVATAFEHGDAQTLLTPAANRVEVSILGAQTIYSDAQAFYVLRAFFERHPPVQFATEDVATEGQSCFVRGRYVHQEDERPLQVYVRLLYRADTWTLQEVRIDSDTG